MSASWCLVSHVTNCDKNKQIIPCDAISRSHISIRMTDSQSAELFSLLRLTSIGHRVSSIAKHCANQVLTLNAHAYSHIQKRTLTQLAHKWIGFLISSIPRRSWVSVFFVSIIASCRCSVFEVTASSNERSTLTHPRNDDGRSRTSYYSLRDFIFFFLVHLFIAHCRRLYCRFGFRFMFVNANYMFTWANERPERTSLRSSQNKNRGEKKKQIIRKSDSEKKKSNNKNKWRPNDDYFMLPSDKESKKSSFLVCPVFCANHSIVGVIKPFSSHCFYSLCVDSLFLLPFFFLFAVLFVCFRHSLFLSFIGFCVLCALPSVTKIN